MPNAYPYIIFKCEWMKWKENQENPISSLIGVTKLLDKNNLLTSTKFLNDDKMCTNATPHHTQCQTYNYLEQVIFHRKTNFTLQPWTISSFIF